MKEEGVKLGRFGEGLCSDGGDSSSSVLVDVEVNIAGIDGLEGEGDVDDVGLVGALPGNLGAMAGGRLKGDGVDACGPGGG